MNDLLPVIAVDKENSTRQWVISHSKERIDKTSKTNENLNCWWKRLYNAKQPLKLQRKAVGKNVIFTPFVVKNGNLLNIAVGILLEMNMNTPKEVG